MDPRPATSANLRSRHQAMSARSNKDTTKVSMLSSRECMRSCAMARGTKRKNLQWHCKSSGPHNSHANAELSTGHAHDRLSPPLILRPARALKSEFPWRPTNCKGGVGIRRTKGDASACLQGWCSAALGSVGSTLSNSKATLNSTASGVREQTNKQTNKQAKNATRLPVELLPCSVQPRDDVHHAVKMVSLGTCTRTEVTIGSWEITERAGK